MMHSYSADATATLNDASHGGMMRPTIWVAIIVFLLILVAHVQQVSQVDLFLNLNGASVEVLPSTFWPAITLFGDTLILLCWMSPLLLFRSRMVLGLVAAIPMGGLASLGFKRLFLAPRPGDVLQHDSFHVLGELLSGHSFPSGHTITAFAAAGVVYACFMSERNHSKAVGVIGGAMVLATFVGLSRVAVGAHWPADVIAGACIGWLSGLNGVWLTRRFSETCESPRFAWVTLCVLAACGVGLQFRHYTDPVCQGITQLATAFVALTLLAKALGQRQFRLDGEG
jgi:membrane-associated phospholipid phosphatase